MLNFYNNFITHLKTFSKTQLSPTQMTSCSLPCSKILHDTYMKCCTDYISHPFILIYCTLHIIYILLQCIITFSRQNLFWKIYLFSTLWELRRQNTSYHLDVQEWAPIIAEATQWWKDHVHTYLESGSFNYIHHYRTVYRWLTNNTTVTQKVSSEHFPTSIFS